jgi:hypothetical protein
MMFRLGEYECAQCGYRQSAGGSKEERASSGPGFRQEQQWGGGQSSSGAKRGGYSLPGRYQGVPVAPPPPPPGSQIYGQQDIYGSPYEPAPERINDSLDIEKKIYFGLQALVGIAMLLVLIFAGGVLSAMGSLGSGSDASLVMGGAVVGGFIGMAIALAILWFVLFGNQVWAKWCCGGCTGLSFVFTVIGFMLPAATMMKGQQEMVSSILQFGISCWFLSILWRDIQRSQG